MQEKVGSEIKLNEISSLRVDYLKYELTEQHISNDPYLLFSEWFKGASKNGVKEPNAMILATVSDNKPKARVVLLKDFSEVGFTFYTNYNSNKAAELEENFNASLTFFWDHSEQQVRIEGMIEKVSKEESDTYFASRPRGNKIGAWVSQQSQRIENREVLELELAVLEDKYAGQEDILRPPFWGGYRLLPELIEFWQGRPNRLHDRICYKKLSTGWEIFRLSP